MVSVSSTLEITRLITTQDDVVSKPFRIPELVPKIQQLVERKLVLK